MMGVMSAFARGRGFGPQILLPLMERVPWDLRSFETKVLYRSSFTLRTVRVQVGQAGASIAVVLAVSRDLRVAGQGGRLPFALARTAHTPRDVRDSGRRRKSPAV